MPDKPAWLDPVGAFVLCMLTIAFMIVTVGPYFGLHPMSNDSTIAANQNAVVNNLFIAAVSFFIGGSVSSRKKDDAISSQASTIAKAQNALAPLVPPDGTVKVDIKPGGTAQVHAQDTPP